MPALGFFAAQRPLVETAFVRSGRAMRWANHHLASTAFSSPICIPITPSA
jgi:hypothetical protein